MNKMMLRMQAMKSMSKEKPSFDLAKIKHKKMMDSMGQMDDGGKGMMSLAVTPEEHKMIMDHRKMSGGDEESSEPDGMQDEANEPASMHKKMAY